MGKHFSFIHCADLHLGEPFQDVRAGAKGPWDKALAKATFAAFTKVVDAALENRVDAILISGDVYNSDHHSLTAQMEFARELYRAAEGGIATFIIHGNHDPGEAWRADIPLPPTTHIFSSDHVEAVPLLKDGETAAMVYGVSYKTQHMHENLAKEFHKKEGDPFAIGMLHTDVGVSGSPYAPCTVDDLTASGMDYWALGHVHTRRTISRKPYIVYPGNTQGLNVNEPGPRGCYLVDVGAYGTVTTKFIETDAIRWLDMVVDISQFTQVDELLADIQKRRAGLKELTGRPNMVRLVLIGRGPLHKAVSTEEGREYILQALDEKEQFRHLFACFTRIDDRTKPELNLTERRELPDVTGSYLSAYDAIDHLPREKKEETLTSLVREQPEMVKYAGLMHLLSKEDILRAFHRAEILGAEMLGAEMLTEEEDHEDH